MTSPDPAWVDEVRACDLRAEDLRDAQARLADERARIVAKAVADYGRGGRDAVAQQLGVKVLQVDTAIKRARTSPHYTGLPLDLLDRLYALELADLPPLPANLWHGLAQTLSGTFIDATWVEQPGALLAMEVEDAAGAELDHDQARRLAAAARSWSRLQALAVVDAIGRDDLDALPTTDEADPSGHGPAVN
ncbi:hypothetical protein [Streptomyces hirsutus]|uniref:hypothetical protein n=1 Tax=Streptomyces hirsutus TaxID=35620 RepID=UPI003316AECC